MTQKNNVSAKIAAGIVGGLVIGGLVVGGYSDDGSKKIAELEDKITELNALQIPEKEIVEVPVDSDNLKIVLNSLHVNQESEGYLELLTEDLDDDELEQIVDRVVFINEMGSLAANAVENFDIADEVEDFGELFNGTSLVPFPFDEDEVERIRVQDDVEDIVVSDLDFDDKDAIVQVDVKFEHEDIKYIAIVDVEIKDGEVEDIEVSSIKLR